MELELNIKEDNTPFDDHNSIDYNGLTHSQISNKTKKLKAKAINHGRQYIADKSNSHTNC